MPLRRLIIKLVLSLLLELFLELFIRKLRLLVPDLSSECWREDFVVLSDHAGVLLIHGHSSPVHNLLFQRGFRVARSDLPICNELTFLRRVRHNDNHISNLEIDAHLFIWLKHLLVDQRSKLVCDIQGSFCNFFLLLGFLFFGELGRLDNNAISFGVIDSIGELIWYNFAEN